ncbi:MAG: neutral/alkaline non-lysosomal ceramidase N-terminal domain-containing protein, partial [Armatimonadota bacterium]
SGSSFRAGTGRATITPPLSAPHAGWGAQTHVFADGIETDLWATVLVVEDGRERASLVDLDLVILTQSEADAIRTEVARVLEVPTENVRVSLTHNHAGPPPSNWDWVEEGKAALARYYGLLPAMAAGAARMALKNLRPARIGVGAGESRVAVNRRETAPGGRPATGVNPAGVIDPHVFVLRIDGADQTPIAAIIGYTMHPTTMGPTSRRISADWPGYLKRTVEQLTGATCLFVQGATGNVGPGPEGFTDDARVIRKLGAMIGCEAVRVYLGLHLPPTEFRHERIWESGAPLGKWVPVPMTEPEAVVRAHARELRLPLVTQPPVAEAEARANQEQRRLRDLIARGTPEAEVEAATFVTKRANMALTRARTFGGRSELPVELHLLQIGPAVLAAIPCEPFAEIALAIKSRSPFPHTWFGGYAGPWSGYLPIPEEYPRKGYEVDTTPYTPEAAGRVVEGTVSALKDLHQQWETAAQDAAGGGRRGRA